VFSFVKERRKKEKVGIIPHQEAWRKPEERLKKVGLQKSAQRGEGVIIGRKERGRRGRSSISSPTYFE